MKKWLSIYLLVSAMCGVGLSVPTYTGERGLQNILSASPERFGKFNCTIGFKGVWITRSDSIGPLLYYNEASKQWEWSDPGKKDRCGLGEVTLGLGFSFTDYLSLNLYTAYLFDLMRTNINVTGSSAVSYGLGDTYLGLKFTPTKLLPIISPEFAKVFELGFYPVISFTTGEERGAPMDSCARDTVMGEPCRLHEGGIHRFYTAGEMTTGGRVLITFNIQTEPKLPVHLNLGYISYPYSTICSKINYGIGLECIYPKFAPFIEIYGEERVDKKYNDGGIYLSPGLRFETAKDVWITFVADFRLTSERPEINRKEYHIQGGFGSAPDWAVSLVISHGYDFRPPPPVGKAVIVGKVIDEDGKSVKAIVFFSDTNVTTDADGVYKIELSPGKIVAYASPVDKDAHSPSEEVTKYVIGGEKEIINFRVKSKPKVEIKPSTLTGKIIDKTTKEPLIATVSFPETSFPYVTSDASGIYRTEQQEGTYIVKIEKEGYIPQTHPVVCKQGATTILDVELSSIPRGSVLVGKVVDYSSRKGIPATINFPGTDIPSVKTDPHTGTYKAEIPDGTHQVKIESDGYVPGGMIIVCKPGETVMQDFELFKKEERIVLRGINFEYNSAVILPSSYSVLDEATNLLRRHPDIMVEIGGHTCSIGKVEYNLRLSQLRAESVKTYLVQQGIPAHRLQPRGYGPTMPIADNSTEASRALNRRIEFRIISQ